MDVIPIIAYIPAPTIKPTVDNIWRLSVDHEKLYPHKFQGNPERIFPLKKSEIAKAVLNVIADDYSSNIKLIKKHAKWNKNNINR